MDNWDEFPDAYSSTLAPDQEKPRDEWDLFPDAEEPGAKDAAVRADISRSRRRSAIRNDLLDQDKAAGRNIPTESLNLGDRAVLGAGEGLQTLKQEVGGLYEAVPIDAVRNFGRRWADDAQKAIDNYQEIGGADKSIAGPFVQFMTSTAMSMLPTIPASYLGGAPAAQITSGLQTFGQTFDEARRAYLEQGLSEDESYRSAYIPATVAGTITALLTRYIPGGPEHNIRAWGGIGPLKDMIKRVMVDAGLEATEEGLDQLSQELISKVSYAKDKPLGTIIGNTLVAAAAGGLLGGAVKGVQEVGGSISRARKPAQVLDQASTPPGPIARDAFAQFPDAAPPIQPNTQPTTIEPVESDERVASIDVDTDGSLRARRTPQMEKALRGLGIDPEEVDRFDSSVRAEGQLNPYAVSRASRRPRTATSLGVRILTAFGVDPDTAEAFVAENPQSPEMDLEDYRSGLIRKFQQRGLEPENSVNIYSENPQTYINSGMSPEEAVGTVEQAKIGNARARTQIKARNQAILQGGPNAINEGQKQVSNLPEYQNGDSARQATETGGGNRLVGSPGQAQIQTVPPAPPLALPEPQLQGGEIQNGQEIQTNAQEKGRQEVLTQSGQGVPTTTPRPQVSKADFNLMKELRDLTMEFNSKVKKSRKNDIILLAQELRNKLSTKGYSPDYIASISNGTESLPVPEFTPTKAEQHDDLIEYIRNNIGLIRGKKTAKPGSEGYYNEQYNQAIKMNALKGLFSNKNGEAPDTIVDDLRRAKVMPEDASVDDLWPFLIGLANGRQKIRQDTKKQNASLDEQSAVVEKFQGVAYQNKRPPVARNKAKPISIENLIQGDEMEIDGEKFVVKDITYNPVSDQLEEVILEDGKKYGVQVVSGVPNIYPDAGTYKPAEAWNPAGTQTQPEPADIQRRRELTSKTNLTPQEADELQALESKSGQEFLPIGETPRAIKSEADIQKEQQQSEMARRQAAPISGGRVEIQRDMLNPEKAAPDIPLFSPEGSGLASEAGPVIGEAKGIEGIRQLVNDPRVRIPAFARQVFNALLDSPVMKDLNWEKLRLELSEPISGGFEGSLIGDLIQMSREATPQTFPHEISHILYRLLPDTYKTYLEGKRMEALRARHGENIPEQLKSGMTSNEFIQAVRDGTLDEADYPLINPSEFLANFFGQNFADQTFKNRTIEPTIWLKFRNWLLGMWDAIKRTFRLPLTMEQVVREMLAGQWRGDPFNGAESEKHLEGSFSMNTEEARNAAAIAQTPAQRAAESEDQSAQGTTIATIMNRLGVPTLTHAARKLLKYADFMGISQTGTDLNGGNQETYNAIKARLQATLSPQEAAYRIKELSRLASQQVRRAEVAFGDAIEKGNAAIKEVLSPTFRHLVDRVGKARTAKMNAEAIEAVTKSMYRTALNKATEALKTEAKDDLAAAKLQAKINELDAAAHSSTAMQQLLEDIVKTLDSDLMNDPDGRAGRDILTGDSTRTEIIDAYKKIKQGRDEPLHNDTLINWAAYILSKNKDLKDQLYASHIMKEPGMRNVMNSFESRFTEELKKDPVKAINAAMRAREKAVRKEERAAVAFMTLNDDLSAKMEEINSSLEAKDAAEKIQGDEQWKTFTREVRDDAGVIGTQKPFLSFKLDNNGKPMPFILPSGNVLEVGGENLQGAKDRWDESREKLQAGRDELHKWLSDPANMDDPNYATHQRNLAELERYFTGLSMEQPNDPLSAWAFSMYIVNEAIRQAGGRVASSAKAAANQWDRIRQRSSWWSQKWSKEITASKIRAMKSYGYKWGIGSGKTLHDAAEQYNEEVGNELAASYARATGGFKAGQKLSNGMEVTPEALADLKTQADATSAGFDIAESEQFSEDTMGDVVQYRKAQKGNDYMTTRRFNRDLIDGFGKKVVEIRKAFMDFLRSRNQDGMDAAEEEMKAVFDSHWSQVGRYFVSERNPDFAKWTVFDGPDGAFQKVAEKMKNRPGAIGSMDDLINEIASITDMEPADVQHIVLNEFSRITQNWMGEAKSEFEGLIGQVRPGETKNAFSKSRNQALAPSVFYKYGFHNTSSDIGEFAYQTHQRSMDRLLGSLTSLSQDIDRQSREFADRKKQIGEKQALNENALSRAKGETYDNWSRLERRKSLVDNVVSQLVGNEAVDREGNITFGRTIGDVTGWLISGIITTLRNITSGPRYLGWFAHRLTGSAWKAYPMAYWRLWADAQAKMLASFGTSVVKAGGLTAVDFTKSLAHLKNPFKGDFWDSTFHRALDEMGTKMFDRVAAVKKLKDEGLLVTDDAAKDFENKMLGSMLTQGKILHRNLSTAEKILQLPATFMELLATFPRTFAPALGDTGLNMGAAGITHWALNQLENKLRKLSTEKNWMAGRFNLDDVQDPKNIMGPQELKMSENELFRLRDEFQGAGLNLDEQIAQFMRELQSDPKAKFMGPDARKQMVEHAINIANRPSPTNTPLNLKAKNFITTIVSPFMQWKARQFAHFLKQIAVPMQASGVETHGDLTKARLKQWGILATMVMLPMLALGGAIPAIWEEQEARVLKKILYNQVNATRQPWERQDAKSQAIGWGIAASFGIPFLDMAVNAAINDLPNRASVDPSLAMVEKFKDVARYVGGAIQTGDITYKLPELIGSILPDTKAILNRLPSEEGKREGNNAVALIRRYGPTELLRPSGDGGGSNANPLSPYGPQLENAILKGDWGEFDQLVAEATKMAEQMGIADPEKRIKQLVLARSPFTRALKEKLTPDQLAQVKGQMSGDERSILDDAEAKFELAADKVGSKKFAVTKEDPETVAARKKTKTSSFGSTAAVPAVARGSRGRARSRTSLASLRSTSVRATRVGRRTLSRRRSRRRSVA